MRVEREKLQPGQESVWDYPRPPRVESSSERIRVLIGDHVLADSTDTQRVLETSHPPVYYIPQTDVEMRYLLPSRRGTFCEWKGHATYFSYARNGRIIEDIAWCYANPTDRFAAIENCIAFYPSKVDACFVGDEQAQPQPGDFYGGWITSKIAGPFKGSPGTMGW